MPERIHVGEQGPLRVSLLGAGLDSGNMGVSALAAGAVKCIVSCFPQADISFFDYGKEACVQAVRVEGRELLIPKLNIRFSRRWYLPNNIAFLLLMATLLRWVPVRPFREWICRRNRWLRHIEQSGLVLSIAGGDSFSDIYGLKRLLYVSLPQVLAILMGKQLVLLPQTIGPFGGWISRFLARYVLNHAETVYTRDHRSLGEVGELVGETQPSAKSRFCYDVGFVVDPIPPADLDTVGVFSRREPGVPLVGMNVSGLLFNGGYSRSNMFGLRADYRLLVYQLIEFLIHQKGAVVLLVPHVFGKAPKSESDWVVCNQIWEELADKYGPRLRFLRDTYDQSELKYIIGKCDFFVGSRMHACIAAISQGVPAVSVAYSDKFVGVMETVQVESAVADARVLNNQAILSVVEECFDRRAQIRIGLLGRLAQVRACILSLLNTSAPSYQPTCQS